MPADNDSTNGGSTNGGSTNGGSTNGHSTNGRLSRRAFFGIAGGAAAGVAAGGLVWNTLVREHLQDAVSAGGPGATVAGPSGSPGSSVPAPGGGRVLVVLQLNGGNDGLNTLVPGNTGSYFDSRPSLQVKESDIVKLAGATYGPVSYTHLTLPTNREV